MVVTIQVVFRVVGYKCFIGPCCLHLQGEVVNGFIIVRIVKFEVMNE
jgi:hypothetical protein